MNRGDKVIYLLGNKEKGYLEGQFLGTVYDLNGRLLAVCQTPLGSFFVCHPNSIKPDNKDAIMLTPSKA